MTRVVTRPAAARRSRKGSDSALRFLTTMPRQRCAVVRTAELCDRRGFAGSRRRPLLKCTIFVALVGLVAPSPMATSTLTGTWVAETRLVNVVQAGVRVTTSAAWGSGNGTIIGSTLLILFSNSPHHYTGDVLNESNCIRFDNGNVWYRRGFLNCPAPSPSPLPPPPAPLPPVAVDVPAWTAHAIIYEIAPKAFSSPDGVGKDGSGSGTLLTAAELLPSLAELGVNAVWLAGWSLSNAHFHGIWSTYATIDLGQIDPTLGGPDGLRTFVTTAHALGIKVVLDVTTHGVVPESPLIAEHRDYFLDNGTAGSW
jgi:hypothetical protein